MSQKVNIDVLDTGASKESFAHSASVSLEQLPLSVPILPLSDCVLFPGMVVPLLIDDPHQIRLIDDVLNDTGCMGTVLLRDPESVHPHPRDLFRTGCLVRIQRMVSTEENFLRILVEGISRFEIKKFTASTADYLLAEVVLQADELDETFSSSPQYQTFTERLRQLFDQYLKTTPSISEELSLAARSASEPAALSNLIAFTLPIALKEKQHLLSQTNVRQRILHLLPLLNRQIHSAQLGAKILKETSTGLSKMQRELYLREQLRAIHHELGDAGNAELERLRALMKKNHLSEEALRVAQHEIDRLEAIPFSSPEYAGIRNYLDWLLNLPWNQEDSSLASFPPSQKEGAPASAAASPRRQGWGKESLAAAKRVLNKNHYGLSKIKERLLEYLSLMKLNPSGFAPILCLVGPPGVGKTSLGRSIALALGRQFCRIALGGVQDVAEIRGHRRTYVSAQPGRIIQNLRRLGTRNPVILLDEIDKVSSTGMGAETAAALLELLDPRQNSSFNDHYLEIPFDLSHVLFIATANWLDPIHPALRDRMEVIEIPGYTFEEKRHIALRHTLPEFLRQNGLPSKFVQFQPAALRKLIESYTDEGGVRGMERQVAAVIRKIVCQKMSQNDSAHLKDQSGVVLSEEQVEKLLGRPIRFTEPLEEVRETGIALGLAWTPDGGDVISVEATRMPGRGELILTGNLGKVLMESVRIAVSFLRSEGKALGVEMSDYEKSDIHVHIPMASVAKDGPSAGVTFAVALASLFSGKKVRPLLSMTGELSLRGRLLPVSGIREKVFASVRFGIKEIILPEANRADWKEIPAQVKKYLKPQFFHHAADAILYALGDSK